MSVFSGFPKEMVVFLNNLEKNNNKHWFDEHKNDYEKFVKNPAVEFVVTMGAKLENISPEINAIPKVNKSLFRVNRDIRFSKDKRPYKTNMGIWFWEGEGKRMECSGYYFHYAKEKIMLGVGMYMFSKDQLNKYRNAVIDKKLGEELDKAVKNVSKKNYAIGKKHYKKTPRGFDPEHPNGEYLLYNGLTAGIEDTITNDFYSSGLIDYAYQHYKNMKPIHDWLKKVFGLSG